MTAGKTCWQPASWKNLLTNIKPVIIQHVHTVQYVNFWWLYRPHHRCCCCETSWLVWCLETTRLIRHQAGSRGRKPAGDTIAPPAKVTDKPQNTIHFIPEPRPFWWCVNRTVVGCFSSAIQTFQSKLNRRKTSQNARRRCCNRSFTVTSDLFL